MCQYHEIKINVPVESSSPEQFVSCILGIPDISKSISDRSLKSHLFNELVVIMHGSQGHKDYCYHRLLASTLGNPNNRMFTIRFDFRNSGESSASHAPRTIAQDVEDLNAVVKYFTSEFLVIPGEDTLPQLKIVAMVGHSRGALPMFEYAIPMKNFDLKLVNCAGRFRGQGLYEKLILQHPNLIQDKGYFTTQTRFGKREINNEWIPIEECNSLISYQMDEKLLGNLPPSIKVLSIYGTKDTIIPVEDRYKYKDTLDKNGNLNELTVIPDADHNFHGVEIYDEKKHQHPLIKHKRREVVDYSPQVVEAIVKFLKK